MAEAKDYYAILGVGRDATDDEIRHAYRKMALKHHPGTTGATRHGDASVNASYRQEPE